MWLEILFNWICYSRLKWYRQKYIKLNTIKNIAEGKIRISSYCQKSDCWATYKTINNEGHHGFYLQKGSTDTSRWRQVSKVMAIKEFSSEISTFATLHYNLNSYIQKCWEDISHFITGKRRISSRCSFKGRGNYNTWWSHSRESSNMYCWLFCRRTNRFSTGTRAQTVTCHLHCIFRGWWRFFGLSHWSLATIH